MDGHQLHLTAWLCSRGPTPGEDLRHPRAGPDARLKAKGREVRTDGPLPRGAQAG